MRAEERTFPFPLFTTKPRKSGAGSQVRDQASPRIYQVIIMKTRDLIGDAGCASPVSGMPLHASMR
jgi:hypothetical protein